MTDDAFDQLDKTKSSGGAGDYAPWWDPDEDDELIGIVVEKHHYTDPGGDKHPVATVRSVGRGDVEKGTELATPTHSSIEGLAGDAELGDIVLLEYEGVVKANTGRDMNAYQTSILKQEEWQQTEQADLFSEVWEASGHFNDTAVDDSGNEDSGGITSEVTNFASDSVDINGGEMDIDELDGYLNDVRDYGVDTEEVVEQTDELELEDDVVVKDD